MSDAIVVTNLSKAFPKRNAPPVPAIDNVSLTVKAGQVFAFLGPNGAGKTTTIKTIKMVCGLITPTGASRCRRRGAWSRTWSRTWKRCS